MGQFFQTFSIYFAHSSLKTIILIATVLLESPGPIRQRKMAALYHEFHVVPTANGTYPRHTLPQLAHALDTVAKGDLRMAVAYLTDYGAPTWAATHIQARVRGNTDRTALKRQHAAAKVCSTKLTILCTLILAG